MDITQFVSNRREALLIGDYNSYRTSLSRQLLATRRRLGRATNKREKFVVKPVTAQDIASNHDFARLLLLTAERAWAHAMQLKSTHAEDNKGITGVTRSHIISRLHKAAKIANELAEHCETQTASGASEQDILEVRAYHASLAGSEEFEKQSEGQRQVDGQKNEERWHSCLRHYSTARVIYAALLEKDKKDMYKDILANTIDPTIRYAAYQSHLSRSIAIPSIAKQFFPREDSKLIGAVEQIDQYALKDKPTPKTAEEKEASPLDIPSSVSWRGRKANIVDASIGQALASVAAAERRLRSYLASDSSAAPRDKAAAYDEVLAASQDAADATKSTIDELEKEKVDEGDSRMQDLRVTSLSVNYELISWRVGRNRVLIGEDDGMTFEPQRQKRTKRLRNDGTEFPEREEPRGRKLARLRERIVLYDASIQSIDSVKDLRGAVRDAKFIEELDFKLVYLRALKCLNLSYSYSLMDSHINALALLKRAHGLLSEPFPTSALREKQANAPPGLDIQPKAAEKLQSHVGALTSRMHAIIEMHSLESNSAVETAKKMTTAAPLIQRLNDCPTPGAQVDLENLVVYPPKIEPVPVKPLFLDVAFNYIDYPGRNIIPVQQQPLVNGVEQAVEPEKKRGWFGFGRG